jgi:hypothetical protein
MKKRPESLHPAISVTAGAVFALAGVAVAQELPAEAREDWYRVELLVFLREDDDSLGAERWEPLPELSYPDDARFLIDPQLADRRLEESGAYASTIDGAGVQQLLLPAPFSPLDVPGRPDSLILEPYRTIEPDVPAVPAPRTDAGSDGATQAGAGAAPAPGDAETGGAPDEPEEQPARIALARPYQLLADDGLEFRGQARSLRRGGQRVAFHGAWWMHLPPDEPAPALFLDRGADPDNASWPDLQGSVRFARSRYLHVDVDLWLNTLAAYLPEGWQIDAPPLPPASINGLTLTGTERNPWAPEPALSIFPGGPDRAPAPGAGTAAEPAGEAAAVPPGAGPGTSHGPGPVTAHDEELAPPYPWRHAIVHRQSRRMRSGEVHYLDHPVIGVVVKLVPAGEDLPPISSEDDLDFAERHGLPVAYVELEDE